MSWPSVKVDQISGRSKYSLTGGPFGSNLTTKDYRDDGVPVIRGVNLPTDRKFSFDDFVWVSEEKADKLIQNNAYPGDLIFTQRGTLGQVGRIPSDSPFSRFVISQSQMKLTVDPALADPDYVYYVFSSRQYKQLIINRSVTSGVPHINLEIFCNITLPLPPIDVQQRIVAILSAYDDLIGNNRRRIKLLEEAARLLYREWFVHLRFPGYEHTPVHDGVPQGWERGTLGDALTLQRGFDLPTSERIAGDFPIYASTGITGYHNQPKVKSPGVVTGRSGSLGTVIYVPCDFWPLNTTLWVKEFKRVSPVFATHLLSELQLDHLNGGAAVPTLNRNDAHRVSVLIPPTSLMGHFTEVASGFYNQIDTLTRYSSKLSEARDLLLPRLMSGEIEVEP